MSRRTHAWLRALLLLAAALFACAGIPGCRSGEAGDAMSATQQPADPGDPAPSASMSGGASAEDDEESETGPPAVPSKRRFQAPRSDDRATRGNGGAHLGASASSGGSRKARDFAADGSIRASRGHAAGIERPPRRPIRA